MPLIVTPGQFTQRAELYHQLAQLTAAGIDLLRALEQLQRHPPARAFRPHLRTLLLEIGRGHTFTESLRACGGWLPEFDLALIEAGERSGRLDACFRLLADYYHDRARVARQMLADLAYPVALFHMAIFIFPFSEFFLTGNWTNYLLKTFGVLLPVYGAVVAMIYAGQSQHGERWRSVVERVLRPVPVLGTARQYLALARLAAALEALVTAGVSIIEAWELAGTACGSPGIRRAVHAWKPDLLGGQTPADSVAACSWFPEMFANLYATGEVSGTLDDSLRKLRRYYQEEGMRKLHAVAQWTPKIIYLIIALGIAYFVVRFWMGIYGPNSDLGKILKGF
jgi:type II secretory pathway component PulF